MGEAEPDGRHRGRRRLVAGMVGLTAVAGVQARVSAQLARAYDASRRALADTRTAQAQTKAALEESQRNLYFASFSLAEREWAGHHIAGSRAIPHPVPVPTFAVGSGTT